jgi:hypothetical protein
VSRGAVTVLVATVLTVAAVLAMAGTRATDYTGASYTTSSQSHVTASAVSVTGWLNVYSEGSDPDGLSGYAHQGNLLARPPIATGRDAGGPARYDVHDFTTLLTIV